MCQLSETSEWWTSLGTSNDERIMTAIARSKARARCNAMAKCSAKFCELTDAKFGVDVNFTDRESRRFFQDRKCVHASSWQTCLL